MTQEHWLTDIAAAVADGRSIDWPAVEARAQSDADRAAIARFRLIEGIAAVHGGADGDGSLGSSARGDAASETRGPSEAPGATWGSLTILDRIGRGTSGDVFRAHDPRLDRVVALKLLRPTAIDAEARASAVVEEGRLLARVQHPNVVAIYGAERHDGRVGLWMEYLRGQTLAEEVRLGGPRSARAIARIGRDLCGALAAVHQAGLLHHDIKAQNVMRTQDDRIVLMDFGAGRDTRVGGAAQPLAGTPAYLAPEVLAGQPATVQSEVYSLGVLLYHLATGTFPVRGRSLADFRDAHASGPNLALLDERTDMPPALVDAIARCLASRPNARFQSPTDLATALAAVSQTLIAQAAVVATERKARWRFSARAAGIAIASALLAGAAGYAVSYTQTPLYASTAILRVELPQVPTHVVAPNIIAPEDVARKVDVNRIGQYLSRTFLEHVITQYGLLPKSSHVIMDDQIEQFRREISIEHVSANGPVTGAPDIAVRVVGKDPRAVQRACERIAARIIDESNRDEEERAEDGATFSRSMLDALATRLAAFDRVPAADGAAEPPARQREYKELEAQYRKWFGITEEAEIHRALTARQYGLVVTLAESGRPPTAPISPDRLCYAGTGAIGGLALGLLLARPRQRLALRR